jgi:hypothetical protein
VFDDPDVADRFALEPPQQRTHPGRVDLAREKVEVGARLGDAGGGLAHAETDFQDAGRVASECRSPVQHAGGVGNAESGQQPLMGRALTGGEVNAAVGETADVLGTLAGRHRD